MVKISMPENLILKFSDFLAEMTGLYFPPNSSKELEKKLQPVAKAFGFKELPECLEWLMKEPLTRKQIEVLAYHLTIGETYFFRDQQAFAALENEILPALIDKNRKSKQLRIWSVAACTGEEVYSIAILLSRMLPDIKDWKIHLLGTDINHAFLLKAELGQYKQWSFRATSKEIQERYFIQKGVGIYELLPQIKELVQFQYLNLVEDSYPDEKTQTTHMDLILCNNVLIYFSHKQIQKVVRQLADALAEDGYLMVSPIEAPYIKEKKLHCINLGGTFLFKKTDIAIKDEKVELLKPSLPVKEAPPKAGDQVLLTIELPSFLKLDQPTLQFHFTDPFSEKDPVEILEDEANSRAKIAASVQEKKKPELIKEIHHLANNGLFEEAQKKCQEAISLDKIDPLLHYLHATVLQSMNDLEGAMQALKRTLFLDDTFAIAYFVLGNIAKRQGKLQEARRHFRNAEQILKGLPLESIVKGTDDLTVENLLKIINSIEAKINP